VDVRDLDGFIEARKQGSARDSETRAPQIQADKTGRKRASVPRLCPGEAVQKAGGRV